MSVTNSISRRPLTRSSIRRFWPKSTTIVITVDLHWREICHGIVEYEGTGTDEMNCFQLEFDRCSNGQCISREFLNADPYNRDCLDRTDEDQFHQVSHRWTRMVECHRDPSFLCEETASYQRPASLLCEDGQLNYLLNGIHSQCANKRDNLFYQLTWQHTSYYHLSYWCWSFLHCLTFQLSHFSCQTLCEHGADRCSNSVVSRCDPRKASVIFPRFFFLPSGVRLGYWTNPTVLYDRLEYVVTPNFTCYDADRCPSIPANFSLDNRTCFHNEQITLDQLVRLFHSCRSTDRLHKASDCSHSSLDSCPNSSKCISKHRLLDGISDCPATLVVMNAFRRTLTKWSVYQSIELMMDVSIVLVGEGVRHADAKLTKTTFFKLQSSTFYSYAIQTVSSPSRARLPTSSEVDWAWFCHRAVPIGVGLNRTARCLCPPSNFGLRLLDEDSIVPSSEQFS